MTRTNPKTSHLSAELDSLKTADLECLRRRWREHYGSAPAPTTSRQLLIGALAYRMQEQAYGGLSPEAARYLDRTAVGTRARPPARRLKPGTVLLREWHGATHEVRVLDEGVFYNGEVFGSLTTVAARITGTHQSGPRFFGLVNHDKN